MNLEKSFEDGVRAGEEMVRLLIELQPQNRSILDQITPKEDLKRIYDWVRGRRGGKFSPYLEGFLSMVVKPKSVNGEIVTLFGIDEFIEAQTNQAPICEMSPELGYIQLGYWTGRSDGDGWCVKVSFYSELEEIRCVPAGSGADDFRNIHIASYAVLDTLLQWVAYLRCSAWERGWLSHPGLSEIFLCGHTFSEGVEAGNRLLKLIREADPESGSLCDEATPPAEFEKVRSEIQERSFRKTKFPCIDGFLSRAMKTKELVAHMDRETGLGRLISIYGTDDLISNQSDFAPILYSPPEAGFTQLAHWTGRSDGDGWWLDTEYGCIRCVYAGDGSEDADENRINSYGVFHSLAQWVAYLRCVAYERGLVDALFDFP